MFCLAVLCGALIGLAVRRVWINHVGQDQSWLLYAARLVLHGAKLNSADVVETNPPFVVWFHALPVLLGRALRVGTIKGFKIFWMMLAVLLGWWSTRLYARLYQAGPLRRWLFAFVITAVGLLVINVEDLGQREHLASMLFLPYLIVAAFRLAEKSLPAVESGWAGVAAAVAVCLKPQQALVIVCVELLLLVRLRDVRKWFSVTTLMFCAGVLLYLLCVALYGQTYLRDILPELTATYWGFNEIWQVLAYTVKTPLLCWIVGCACYAWLRKTLPSEGLASVLLVASLGALMAYLQQHKGWHYQLVCFTVFSCLLLGVMAIDRLSDAVRRTAFTDFGRQWRGRPAVYLLAALLLSFAASAKVLHTREPAQPEKWELAQIYAAYPRGSAVGFISVFPWEFPAVLEQDKVLGSRYLHLWMLGALVKSEYGYPYEVQKPMKPSEREMFSDNVRTVEAEDLSRWKPVVVVVDRCTLPQFCDDRLKETLGGLVDWMKKSPSFQAEWAHYRFEKAVGSLDVYTRLP